MKWVLIKYLNWIKLNLDGDTKVQDDLPKVTQWVCAKLRLQPESAYM